MDSLDVFLFDQLVESIGPGDAQRSRFFFSKLGCHFAQSDDFDIWQAPESLYMCRTDEAGTNYSYFNFTHRDKRML